MVGLLKYEFDNKLLVVVTFFRVTLGVTWTQPIFHNLMLILTNLPLDYIIFIFFMLTKFQGDQRLILMSSTNCLDSSFSGLK